MKFLIGRRLWNGNIYSCLTITQVADYLVPNIREIPTNQSMKPTYIRFLTGLKAYSRIFSVRILDHVCCLKLFLEILDNAIFCICNTPSLISPVETSFWCSKKQVCYWGLVVPAASFQIEETRNNFFHYLCWATYFSWNVECVTDVISWEHSNVLLFSFSVQWTQFDYLIKVAVRGVIYFPCYLYGWQISNHTWTTKIGKSYNACSRVDHDTYMHLYAFMR